MLEDDRKALKDNGVASKGDENELNDEEVLKCAGVC